jgi:hypothetical protein
MSEFPRTPGDAEEFVEKMLGDKPQLMVHAGDLPATARALRDLLAKSGYLFERDVPVKLVQPADAGPMKAIPLTANTAVIEAHSLCQPVKLNRHGELVAVTLPERVARMYLDIGEWNLRPLAGITTAPVLAADGGIRDIAGYDRETGLWCCKVPKLEVPQRPSFADAKAALRLVRNRFKTFPFADAARRHDPDLNVEIVDLDETPRRDESAFLAALLTAVCRPSLWLAPGFLIEAPALSGAGTGKGLLVRAICAIAFGIRPRAFRAAHDRQELEKRIAADLMQAAPALFLDNVNGAVLRSDTLAAVITERPTRVRVFGELKMAALNSTAFVAITGNGLTVSEDLARRFIDCKLDAGCEHAEARPFSPGFLEQVQQNRVPLLSAALTIWRFGRQNLLGLTRGRSAASRPGAIGCAIRCSRLGAVILSSGSRPSKRMTRIANGLPSSSRPGGRPMATGRSKRLSWPSRRGVSSTPWTRPPIRRDSARKDGRDACRRLRSDAPGRGRQVGSGGLRPSPQHRRCR